MPRSMTLLLSAMLALISGTAAGRQLRQATSYTVELDLVMEGQFAPGSASYCWQALISMAKAAALPEIQYDGMAALPTVTYGEASELFFSFSTTSSSMASSARKIFTPKAINARLRPLLPPGSPSVTVRTAFVVAEASGSRPSPLPTVTAIMPTHVSSSAGILSLQRPSKRVSTPVPKGDGVNVYLTVAVESLAGPPRTSTSIYVLLAINDCLKGLGIPVRANFGSLATSPFTAHGPTTYSAVYTIGPLSGADAARVADTCDASSINAALPAVVRAKSKLTALPVVKRIDAAV